MTCTQQTGPSSDRLKQAPCRKRRKREREKERKREREKERENERGNTLLRSVYEHRRKSSKTKRAGPL
jgi:hypothetical protein